ncbi:MAG: hypothetical protein IPF66_06020 [Holophagales bacterium]|nr:hypothetical protein [Holophagales bacterium]
MTQQIGGRTVTHYWRVSPQMSALVRQGEEEHLADAARAFALTYQLVADAINALVGGGSAGEHAGRGSEPSPKPSWPGGFLRLSASIRPAGRACWTGYSSRRSRVTSRAGTAWRLARRSRRGRRSSIR